MRKCVYRGHEVPFVAFLLLAFVGTGSGLTYYMDRPSDCGIGTYDVPRDTSITIMARSGDTSTSTQGACTMNFKTVDYDATLALEFVNFDILDCGKVNLYLAGDATTRTKTYGCSDNNPDDYYTIDRTITITLHKTEITNQNYNFRLQLRAVREKQFPPPGDSNPMAVGLVVGIVGSVFGIIIIASIIGICCFRKHRVRGPTKSPYIYNPNSKTRLDDNQSHNASVGFTNENLNGSPMSKRKLLAPSDSSDEKSEKGLRRPVMSNYKNNSRTNDIPPPPNLKGPPIKASENVYNETNDVFNRPVKEKNQFEERGVDAPPRNPMLSALRSNSKFQDTFQKTEKEAEERAKRISSTSSYEEFGVAPTPPDSNENLSRPNLPPVPTSPTSKKGQKTARIGRNPRSNSFSSDELKKIEKGVNDRDKDPNIKVMHDTSTGSSTEVVPIKVKESNKKSSTTHALKPDRKKKKDGRNQSVSSAIDADQPKPSPRAPREKERVQAFEREFNDNSSQNGSGRYSKRTGRKSPRQPGRGSGGKGFSHRRGRSADPYDSRPTTPISNYGSMEDLESLPPLQRAGSKNSLYASRSSLYDRRRRRKGSASSVVSYGTTRDDISVGRRSQNYDSYSDEDDFDGYEKPLSRRDRDRIYRSENDLGQRGKKEISTQTLRETATQTGPNESVVMQPKMLVKRRKRSKSLSTAGTQTQGKKTDEEKTRKRADTESFVGTDDERKKKRKSRRTKSAAGSAGTLKGKRSKSLDMLGVDEEKPKVKPKPAPRKSTSAMKDNISGSTENLHDVSQSNPYYPQSEGFNPGYHPQGYPMVPPPVYPGHGQPLPGQPVQGQFPYQGVPNYPPNSLPQQPSQQMMNGITKPVPRGPKKSNWELLCEMTDGQRRDDQIESGSVASSVFTNNPINYQPYPPQTMGPPGVQPYYNNQGYYPPPPQPQYYPGPMVPQYSQYPQGNMRAQSVPDFMHDLSVSTSSDDTQEREEKRQATIAELKGQAKKGAASETQTLKIANGRPHIPKQNNRTESVV